MMRHHARLVAALLMAAGSLLPASISHAQTSTTITVRLPVRDVMHMSLSTTNVQLPTPTTTAFDGSVLPAATGPAVTVQSNRAWVVSVSAASAATNFTYSAPPGLAFTNPAKPLSELQWGTSGSFVAQGNLGGTGNLPFTTGAVGSAAAYSPTAGASTTLYLRALWSWTRDVPGTYSATLNLTLSTP